MRRFVRSLSSTGRSQTGSLPVRGLRKLLRFYQLTFSSLVGTQCRHLPTCSAYMDEALARHGVWAGLFIGLARLSRCHPWGTAGYDPVPDQLDANVPRLQPWRHGRWRGPLEITWKPEHKDQNL